MPRLDRYAEVTKTAEPCAEQWRCLHRVRKDAAAAADECIGAKTIRPGDKFFWRETFDGGANLGRYGQLSHWIAIRTPRQRLSHDPEKDESLARFGISDLVPEFHWSARHFQTYPEFCRAVDTTAYAALCIFRKVDAALMDGMPGPSPGTPA